MSADYLRPIPGPQPFTTEEAQRTVDRFFGIGNTYPVRPESIYPTPLCTCDGCQFVLDQDTWSRTAVGALLQVVHSPEIEACLSPIQMAAVRRVDAGYREIGQ